MMFNRSEVVQLRERVVQLERQLATAQAHVDWLSAHVNRLEGERSTLLSRVLQIQLPAPEIVRDHAPPTPAQNRIAGVPIEDDYGNSIPALQASQNSFDDVGDEAASALGIVHDRMGNVVHTR